MAVTLQSRKSSVKQLYVALDGLRPLQRTVLYLRFWENWEITEIAHLTQRRWTDIDHLIEITLIELRYMLSPMPEIAEEENSKSHSV